MSKKIQEVMETIEVRYKGIYHFEGLYRDMRGWFDEHRYDFMETLYKDKIGNEFGNETEINMECELKVNEWVKFHIDVKTKFFEVKEFEAVVDGDKKLLTDGRFWIKLNGWVEFDYSNMVKKNTFEEKVQDFMIGKLFRRYYEFKYYDKVTKEVYDLQTSIKKFLKMETEHNAYT